MVVNIDLMAFLNAAPWNQCLTLAPFKITFIVCLKNSLKSNFRIKCHKCWVLFSHTCWENIMPEKVQLICMQRLKLLLDNDSKHAIIVNTSVWFSPPGNCNQLLCLSLGAAAPSQHLLRRVHPAHLRIHHSAGTHTLLLILSWLNTLSRNHTNWGPKENHKKKRVDFQF